MPTWHDAATDYFDHVELTNDDGATYAVRPDGTVIQAAHSTGDIVKLGKATITFTLLNGSSQKPTTAQLQNVVPSGDESKSISLYLTKEGYAKVIGTKATLINSGSQDSNPQVKDGDNHAGEFAHANVEIKLTILANGTYSVSYQIGGAGSWYTIVENQTSDTPNGTWTLEFYYAMAPVNSEALDATNGVADTAEGHAADKIKVATSLS